MYGRKIGKCLCGKKRVRQKKFGMPLSPLNRNEDGTARSKADIYMALGEQIDTWRAEPITCEVCEPKAG